MTFALYIAIIVVIIMLVGEWVRVLKIHKHLNKLRKKSYEYFIEVYK